MARLRYLDFSDVPNKRPGLPNQQFLLIFALIFPSYTFISTYMFIEFAQNFLPTWLFQPKYTFIRNSRSSYLKIHSSADNKRKFTFWFEKLWLVAYHNIIVPRDCL